MPRVPFQQLPDHGRLWVFPATSALDNAQAERFLEAVDRFLDGWAAHGVALTSARELIENRFLLIGVDVDRELPSGCSIDALVNQLRALGAELGVSVIDHAPVWYRAGDSIESVTRGAFRQLAADQRVTSGTHVFDTSLTSVDALREGALERPAAETWHGRAFFKAPAGS